MSISAARTALAATSKRSPSSFVFIDVLCTRSGDLVPRRPRNFFGRRVRPSFGGAPFAGMAFSLSFRRSR
jgi:hypothetical protein